MKIELLKKIIENKNKKIEFSIITDLDSGESFVFEKNEDFNKNFKKYKKQINLYIDKKKNGILEGTNIFIDNDLCDFPISANGTIKLNTSPGIGINEINL